MLHKNKKEKFYDQGKHKSRTYDFQTFLHTLSYEKTNQNNCINHILRYASYAHRNITRYYYWIGSKAFDAYRFLCFEIF